MTPTQSNCLRAIAGHWRAFSESPTRAELGIVLGITKVSAHLTVRRLERDGLVVTHPGKWRNIELTAAGSASAKEPQ